MSLSIGEKAPAFEGLNQDGQLRTLKDFKGKKLALYFYPKDLTPACTSQACSLRDDYKNLTKKGYAIVGVSADSVKKHRNFADKFELPFDLIADTELSIIKAYGVWGLKKFMGREYEGIIRTTFIIDEKGKIEHIISKVNTKEHAAQILENS